MHQPVELASPVRWLLLLLVTASWMRIWAAAIAPSEAAAEAGELSGLAESWADIRSLERRYAEIERNLSQRLPVAVRKMSEDPSEMFFPEYWHFELEQEELLDPLNHLTQESGLTDTEAALGRNSSKGHDFLPPLLPHHQTSSSTSPALRNLARNVFKKREYNCLNGFHNCNSIGFIDACCARGERCQLIKDTGLGVVGCCPKGTKCKGSVSECDESAGYTSCPHQINPNGCCAPGFVCDALGCVRRRASTTTRTLQPVTTTRTFSTTTVGPSTVFTTTTYPTSTRTIGPVVQSQSTNTRVITRTLTSATPAVRPTDTIGLCPTGFYRCSAFYIGRCCRVGRDCRSTHCPLIISAEATENGVVTIVVATGNGVTTTYRSVGVLPPTGPTVTAAETTTTSTSDQNLNRGPCAEGWYKCGLDGGGGCCPTGYRCSSKCVATQSGIPGSVLKAPPKNHAVNVDGWGSWMIAFAAAIGIAMVWL